MQRVKYCSGTFSGPKTVLCAEEITVISHRCTLQGRLPDPSCIDKITSWGPCRDLSEMHTFLGTLGICCIFIPNFTKQANALINLTHKDIPFEFGPTQIAAQADLKEVLLNSQVLQPIDYNLDAPVILAVNTSHIAVGFYLCQADIHMPKKCYYTHLGPCHLMIANGNSCSQSSNYMGFTTPCVTSLWGCRFTQRECKVILGGQWGQ